MSDCLDAREISARLTTRFVGHPLELYAEIDSTNRRAVDLARAAAPEGALVLAEAQTAGRGRLGRRWHSPAGSSLLMSLLLRPPLRPTQVQRAVMACSLGLVEGIAACTGLEAGIKWPNDVVIAGKKVAGLLAELDIAGQQLTYVVIGMGLNVNLDVSALPDVLAPATSLAAEAGHSIARLDLLLALLEHIEQRYLALLDGQPLVDVWRAHLATLGQPVRVGTPEQVLEGVAQDVNEDGALLVRTPDGELHTILTADVTLRGHRTVPATE